MKEIIKHVEAQNVKMQAWIDACPEGEYRAGAIYTEDEIQEDVEHYGIKRVEDWEAAKAWEDYYEMYKSVNGTRPWWTNWKEKTAEEWDQAASNIESVQAC